MTDRPGSRVFFTSDTHFYHRRVLELCARPFRDLDEMHSEIVRRWNARVVDGDMVYHLGDVSFGSFEKTAAILGALRGRKLLVRGNHDRGHSDAWWRRAGFEWVCETADAVCGEDDTLVRCVHAPGPGHETGAPHPLYKYTLCGHVHNRWARAGDGGRIVNVGVDVRGFEPRTLAEMLAEPWSRA